MLERIREGSQGIVAKTILCLVILTFAVSGIGSYISNQAETALAVVNDVEITQASFENAYQNERSRMEQQFGAMFEQLLADESYVANFRKNILDRLIVEELQKQNAQALGVRVGDDQIRKAILEMPEFQLNGEFNNDQYKALLRQAGYQPSQFRESMREQMARTQYASALFTTDFVLPSEVNAFNELYNQTRSFEQVIFSIEALKSGIKPEQTELEEYFEANKLIYQTEEQVAVEYIVIDSNALASSVEVSESDIENYYNDNLLEYTQAEKRRLSHILIEAGDDENAAKVKAEELKSKINAGESFAELAKVNSSDTFSAENGGDLDWVETGIMGETFDEAAFALKNVNDVTDVVKTNFGFHIIKLTELQPEVVTPLNEVQSSIKTQLASNKAAELYIEAQTKAVEISFEVPDTLQDAADEAGLIMQTTELLSRSQLPGDLVQPQVVTKLFDQDFIAEGINSELIELGQDKSILIRVLDHKAPEQQLLADVNDKVKAAVIENKAQELAKSQAQEALDKANAGESFAVQGLTVERKDDIKRSDRSLDNRVTEAVFALAKPAEGVIEYELVDLLNGDVAVIALDKVSKQDAEDPKQAEAQLNNIIARIATQAYIEAMKANADINIYL